VKKKVEGGEKLGTHADELEQREKDGEGKAVRRWSKAKIEKKDDEKRR